MLGLCCKCSACLVGIAAVLTGLLFSGHLVKTGIFTLVDDLPMPPSWGPVLKGMVPAVHEGSPWGFTLEEIPDLSGQSVFVTGGNVGLGYWTAYHLAAHGASAIIGCRSQSKCDQAAESILAGTGKTVETASLDLSSFKSIQSCAKDLSAKHPLLDSLVLNAGVMMCPFTLTEDGLEMQIGTNHFGHFLLTKLLLPTVERAAEAKGVATIVSVSSAAHYSSYPEGILPSLEAMNVNATYERPLAYGQSKLANVLFAQELAERVQGKNILVNSVHPGMVDTALGRHIEDVVATIAPSLVPQMKSTMASFTWHPREAALTQIYTAVGPKLKRQRITGKYFHPIARETRPDRHTFNATLQKHLWDMSEQVVGNYLG